MSTYGIHREKSACTILGRSPGLGFRVEPNGGVTPSSALFPRSERVNARPSICDVITREMGNGRWEHYYVCDIGSPYEYRRSIARMMGNNTHARTTRGQKRDSSAMKRKGEIKGNNRER